MNDLLIAIAIITGIVAVFYSIAITWINHWDEVQIRKLEEKLERDLAAIDRKCIEKLTALQNQGG